MVFDTELLKEMTPAGLRAFIQHYQHQSDQASKTKANADYLATKALCVLVAKTSQSTEEENETLDNSAATQAAASFSS